MHNYNPMKLLQRLKIVYLHCILAVTLLISSLLILSACRNESTRRISPEAVKGVLDLTKWDFEKDGLVKLKGEWEFYWQQHLIPQDFTLKTAGRKTGFIEVPGY